MIITVFQPRLIELDRLDVPASCPECGKEVYVLLRDQGRALVMHSGLNFCLLPSPDSSYEDEA